MALINTKQVENKNATTTKGATTATTSHRTEAIALAGIQKQGSGHHHHHGASSSAAAR